MSSKMKTKAFDYICCEILRLNVQIRLDDVQLMLSNYQ